jgi:hypothetical protein
MAALRSLRVSASYAARDMVAPLFVGERPRGDVTGRRLRAWGAAMRGLVSARQKGSTRPD